MTATQSLIREVLSLNPKCTSLGPGKLAHLIELARQADEEEWPEDQVSPMEVRCRYQHIKFTSAVGTDMDQFHREVERLLAEGWEVGGPRTDTKLANDVYLHHQTFSKVEQEA